MASRHDPFDTHQVFTTILREFHLIAVQRGRLMPREVGQRLVVIDNGPKLLALRRGEIALKVEHKSCCAQSDFQSFQFGFQLFLGHDASRASGLDALKVCLDSMHRFAHTDDDLLANIGERHFGILRLELALVIRADSRSVPSG